MPDKCPRCGSTKIIPDVPLWDHYGDMGLTARQTEIKVHGQPQAFIFKDSSAGTLSIHICGECGHAELQVSGARELYEKHERSRESQ